MESPEKKPKGDGFLKLLEIVTVTIVALSIWLAAVFVALWIAFGTGDAQIDRLLRAVNGINVNWKIALLLLLPLFYRTVREILERIEEGPLGTKFPHPKSPVTTQEVEETRPDRGKNN